MRLDCSLLFAFPLIDRGGAAGTIIFIETVLLDIANHRNGNQVADAHLTPQEQADLSTANIILNELLNDVDVVAPWL